MINNNDIIVRLQEIFELVGEIGQENIDQGYLRNYIQKKITDLKIGFEFNNMSKVIY